MATARGRGASRQRQAAPTARRRPWSLWFNRALVLCGALVVLVASAQAWSYLQRIPVQRISVTGKLEQTRTEAVQEMVQPALAGGFMKADLEQVRQQLEALPWIYRATVRRVWPNALEIHVVEQLPIARWGEGGFLNHQGEVFHSERGEQWQDLPRLSGPAGTEEALMASYQQLKDMLRPLELEVQALSRDARGQLRAELAGGLVLLIGNEDFKQRVRRFVALYPRELAARATDIERIDLRYQRGLAVSYREPAQVAGV